MDEILKKLVKDKILNEENMTAIQNAFDSQVNEAKEKERVKVRKELNERYESDMSAIHTAMEKYLEMNLGQHVAKLHEEITSAKAMKKRLAERHAKLVPAAKKAVKERVEKIEQGVSALLEKEIKELHESEKAKNKVFLTKLAEREAEIEATREKLIEKSAALVNHIINVKLAGTMKELKEDIRAARKSNFGMKIYEAFEADYRTNFFNTDKEAKALLERAKKAEKANMALRESAIKKVKAATKRAKLAEAAMKKQEEKAIRATKIAKLTEGLAGAKKDKMVALLEATPTDRLGKTYRDFLPEIVKEEAPKKTVMVESTKKGKGKVTKLGFSTGGVKPEVDEVSAVDDREIREIKARAGIRN